MKTELLLVVSDMHCGSDVGLAPPATKTKKGNVVSFGENFHQEWLWQCWTEAAAQAKQIIGKSRCALLVNGDATEGAHHGSRELIALEIETHVGMAVECLRVFTKFCSESYVVKGTECHTLEMESLLAERIGAKSGAAKDRWLIDFNGCLVDAAHHMPTTSRAYLEAGAMSIVMGNARVNYARAGQRIPQVFLRAHRHCGGYYSDSHGLFGVTGAWQFLTRHGHKVVTESLPRPSVMLLDWRGKPEGSLPAVHSICFNPPQDDIEKS